LKQQRIYSKARMMQLKILVIGALISSTSGHCSNQCHAHGVCELTQCNCFEGWTGGSCELKMCPKGYAWNDYAQGTDDAHNLMECAGRGKCERTTGICQCDPGMSGNACQYKEAPSACWGRGKPYDMKYNAIYKDPGLGTVYSYTSIWDAEKIYGCECDQGFTGYDCSRMECPKGDDPMTVGQVDEVQLIHCVAENGYFTLQFQGHTSEPIPVNSEILDFEAILEAIPGVGDVSITFSESGLFVCLDESARKQIVSITFLENFGDLYNLVSPSTHTIDCAATDAADYNLCGGTGVSIITKGGSLENSDGNSILSVASTKENIYCSGRGSCDLNSGVCTCYSNYETSDGRGLPGTRGDCGFRVNEVASCPGAISCSGHGVCSNSPEYKCDCSAGWAGGDCSERSCSSGKSWFDHPISNDRAHQITECSDMGVCDIVTGLCSCYNGFDGASCNQMRCPGVSEECSGHGQCLSLAQLANKASRNGELEYTTYGATPNNPRTWDYDMIYGCHCDNRFGGHDCSLLLCPFGDDPETGYAAPNIQYHEVKLLQCTADAGNLRVYFRQQTTGLISFGSSAAAFRDSLIAIASITDVEITYSSGASLCTSDGSNVVSIKFTQDLGDLPFMIVYHNDNSADLTQGGGAATITTAEDGVILNSISSIKGSHENIECSGRGTCDHELGTCSCYAGYGSSNGNMEAGDRGDCGFKIPWYYDDSASSSSGSASNEF